MIKIEFFRASKSDVKPGETILISGLVSSDIDANYLVNLHIIGTNIKKESLKINAETKDISLVNGASQKVAWNVSLPKTFSTRFNFIGYIQWISKSTNDAGIISSYLFSAGQHYDVEITEDKLVYGEKGEFTKLQIHAINREIEPINLKIPLVVDKKGQRLLEEVYETILNYEEIIEIDVDPVKPVRDAELSYAVMIGEVPIKKSSKVKLFPDYKEETIKYDVILEDRILKEETIEVSIYLRDQEIVKKRAKYFDLNIFDLGEGSMIMSLNNTVIFGLDWDNHISDNPFIYDSFKDFLFSYVFFDLFAQDIPKELELWKINKTLSDYLKKQSDFEEKKTDRKLLGLIDICTDIIELYENLQTRNFVSNNQFKNLNVFKKRFYTNYVKIKEDIIGVTEKERKNFGKALDKMEADKKRFKKKFTEMFNGLEEEMKIRNILASLRRFLNTKISRESNKLKVGEECSFRVQLRNESELNSLPVKMTISASDDRFRIIKPKGSKKDILVLPEKYSGWIDEEVTFILDEGAGNIQKPEIRVILEVGVT